MKQKIEHRNSKGQLHCEDGPAFINYYENGSKKYEAYYLNDKLHRTDGPATIGYYENGSKNYEVYYSNGQIHRIDGPAYIHYFKNGNKKYEQYYLNDFKLEDWCEKYNILFKTKRQQKHVIDNLEKIYKTFSIFK